MTKEEINDFKKSDLWMIRPCEIYKSEYDECTAIASRFHQMFIHGSTVDCNLWHVDYQNCLRWKNDKDIKSAETLIQSETDKRSNRYKAFYANNVWENRKTPPENWNMPLPDYIAQRRSNSSLKDSLNDYSNEGENNSSCSIM